jgi:hypothetical protein
MEFQISEVDALPAPFSLLYSGLGLFSIVGFQLLLHIQCSPDGTMETMVCTSEVNAIPGQFSVPFNVFLKLIIVPYGCL